MKKKLFLFVMLLFGLISVEAADGTVSVSNVRNAVPGQSGTFDVVLSGTDVTYTAFQCNITLPEGFTITGYEKGELMSTNHNIASNKPDADVNKWIFVGVNSPGQLLPFTGLNGVLVTITFAVDNSVSVGEHTGGKLEECYMSESGVSHTAAGSTFSITTTDVWTLYDDETEAPAAMAGINVKVERALKGGVWNTLCLPFPMNAAQITSAFGSDAQIAELQGVTYTKEYNEDEGEAVVVGVKLSFGSVTEMAAHHPYIIKVSAPITEFTVSSVTITAGTPSYNVGTSGNYKQFIGTYTTEAIIPDGCLYLMDNSFKYSQGTSKLKAFRAYFRLRDKLYGYDTPLAPAPAITFDIDGISTGISTLDFDAEKTVDAYYNVQGLQVAQPTKGLYIVNGRKVIIK